MLNAYELALIVVVTARVIRSAAWVVPGSVTKPKSSALTGLRDASQLLRSVVEMEPWSDGFTNMIVDAWLLLGRQASSKAIEKRAE